MFPAEIKPLDYMKPELKSFMATQDPSCRATEKRSTWQITHM